MVNTLSSEVSRKLLALRGLASRLEDVKVYLDGVGSGELEINHEILSLIQEVINLLPNINIETLALSLTTKTNDMMLPVYVSSLVRGVIALHNLINNKVSNKDREKTKPKSILSGSVPNIDGTDKDQDPSRATSKDNEHRTASEKDANGKSDDKKT